VSQQWHHLNQLKKHGYGFTAEKLGFGDLATFCPTCPQPDVNLPDNWRKDSQQWMYTHTYVMDGNFSAKHQKMKNTEDDNILSDRGGFFVADGNYKAHLKSSVEAKEVRISISAISQIAITE
jgi:hypothetical protein